MTSAMSRRSSKVSNKMHELLASQSVQKISGCPQHPVILDRNERDGMRQLVGHRPWPPRSLAKKAKRLGLGGGPIE